MAKDGNVAEIEKIVGVIKTIFGVILIWTILLGIALFAVQAGNSIKQALITLVEFALLAVICWISMVMVTTFLQALANIEQNTKNTAELVYCLSEVVQNELDDIKQYDLSKSTDKNKKTAENTEKKEANISKILPGEVKYVTQYPDEYHLVCPYCGVIQPKNRRICFSCEGELIDMKYNGSAAKQLKSEPIKTSNPQPPAVEVNKPKQVTNQVSVSNQVPVSKPVPVSSLKPVSNSAPIQKSEPNTVSVMEQRVAYNNEKTTIVNVEEHREAVPVKQSVILPDKKVCPKCKIEYDLDSRFCQECGAPLQ